jgi:hypothetical protein
MWDSLQSQGFSFAVQSATADHLSEVALSDGLLIGPGESQPIGLPFLLQADADGNGTVDLSDFSIWKSNRDKLLYGPSAGDFNLNGVVDLDDFDYFLTEMGTAAAYSFAATTVVPEPSGSSLWHLLAGTVVIFGAARCGLVAAEPRSLAARHACHRVA